MKSLVAFISVLIAMACPAATYYVATNGTNANTGLSATYTSGTTGPWLTIVYALAHSAAGDTVYIEDGTYAESSYLQPNVNYASRFTLAGYSADPTKVTIVGASGSYNVLHQASNMSYINIGISNKSSSDDSVLRYAGGTNVVFSNCLFTLSAPANNQSAIDLSQSSGANATNVSLISCTVTQVGNANTGVGLYFQTHVANMGWFSLSNCTFNTGGWAVKDANYSHDLDATGCNFTSTNTGCMNILGATNYFFTNCTMTSRNGRGVDAFKTNAPLSGLVLSSCTITGTSDGVFIDGGSGIVIENSSIGGGTSHGIAIGEDAVYETNATMRTTGTIIGNAVYSTTGHCTLIGVHADGVIFNNNVCNGGNYGLVLKTCSNADVENNTINGGSTAAMLFKGTLGGCVVKHNRIYSSYGASGIYSESNDSLGFTNIYCTYNWVVCPTVIVGVDWASSGGSDLGGSTLDCNSYFFTGPVNIGRTNLGTIAPSFERWRTNWTGYSISGNETHSTFGPTFNPGFAQ